MSILVRLICVLMLSVGSGCYYTVTRPDGTTERISREEYTQLKEEGRAQSHVGVPQIIN